MDKVIHPVTYNYNFACGNCNQSIQLRIPRGITLWKFGLDHECPNCGCKLIPQDEEGYRLPSSVPVIYLPYSLRRG